MRLLLDCRYIRPGRPDGIGRYTTGLAWALHRRQPIELLVSDPAQLDGLPDRPWHRAGAPTSVAEPLLARRVNRIGADVVVSPMQTMGSIGRRYALILTVHDLIYYRHPTPPPWLPLPVRLLWRLYHLSWQPQRVLLDRADTVAAVSESTAGLVRTHRLTRRPVVVVPDATDFQLSDDAPPRIRPEGPQRLVHVGSGMPYKNVDRLAAAASLLPGYELHLVGHVPDAVRDRLRELAGRTPVIVHSVLDDATYRALLDSAVALLSASADEGFGLPVLEALARGTPVVVSDIPAHREVAGAAGRFVPRGDPAGIARSVRDLEDAATWAEASAVARRKAAERTWERSAGALLAAAHDTVARAGGDRGPRRG